MDLFLYYKVKVANSMGMLLLMICGPLALAQNHFVSTAKDNSIVLTCTNSSLEEILLQIEKQTTVHFIYNPSLVKASKPLSLTVRHRSLTDVLDLLEKNTNLSFRKEGDHIVVKKMPTTEPVTAQVAGKNANTKLSAKLNLPVLNDELKGKEMEKIVEKELLASKLDMGKSLPKEALWRRAEFTMYDTALLAGYKVALHNITNPSNQQSKWFVSVSILSNDFSISTLEGKLGHRSIYAVIDGSLLLNEPSFLSYGAGTAFPITKKIAMTPIYLYSQTSRTENFVLTQGFNVLAVKDGYRKDTQGHQLKFILQFNPTTRLGVQAGPVYNISFSTHSITVPQEFPYGDFTGSGPRPAAPNSSTIKNTSTDSWIGFEFGIHYRIDLAR
jgi:hypothetical protein